MFTLLLGGCVQSFKPQGAHTWKRAFQTRASRLYHGAFVAPIVLRQRSSRVTWQKQLVSPGAALHADTDEY